MIPLRLLAGFAPTAKEDIEASARTRKLAMPWEETEAPHLVVDRTTWKKRLISRYQRRDAGGKVIGDIKQIGVAVEWTAEGSAVSVENGVVLGKVRVAPTLLGAMENVDAHLEARGWTLVGKIVYAPVAP